MLLNRLCIVLALLAYSIGLAGGQVERRRRRLSTRRRIAENMEVLMDNEEVTAEMNQMFWKRVLQQSTSFPPLPVGLDGLGGKGGKAGKAGGKSGKSGGKSGSKGKAGKAGATSGKAAGK